MFLNESLSCLRCYQSLFPLLNMHGEVFVTSISNQYLSFYCPSYQISLLAEKLLYLRALFGSAQCSFPLTESLVCIILLQMLDKISKVRLRCQNQINDSGSTEVFWGPKQPLTCPIDTSLRREVSSRGPHRLPLCLPCSNLD